MLVVRTVCYSFLVTVMVTVVVPWLILGRQGVDAPSGWRWLGVPVLCAAAALYVWCTILFIRRGGGTLDFTCPPQRLVDAGPYARTRNPIYVAVVTSMLGTWICWPHPWMAWYLAGSVVWILQLVLLWEEPGLRRRHGAAWESYARRVPRFLPRLVARSSASSQQSDHIDLPIDRAA